MRDAASDTLPARAYWVGFDPGRDKCGIAVVDDQRTPHYHEVVPSERAIATLQSLQGQFAIQHIILGDQTTSSAWKRRLEQEIGSTVPICLVDERYTTLEARDRYWTLYPPTGLQRLVPKRLRSIARPIDDIVAILLVERYLAMIPTT